MKSKRFIVIALPLFSILAALAILLMAVDTLAAKEDQTFTNSPIKTGANAIPESGGGDLILTKTVGTDQSNCALERTIFVPADTRVYYCFRVHNTGGVTLTVHNLIDTQLGVILPNVNIGLGPNNVIWLTRTAVITQNTINTATWEAYNPGPIDVNADTDYALVFVEELPPQCHSPHVSIPDNLPAGLIDSQTGTTSANIVDLDIYIDATHTWVGDLNFTIEHVDTGTTATLIDRPGVPASTFGCSSNHIHITLDDDASLVAEDTCDAPYAFQLGGSYAPSDTLDIFNGLNFNSEWTLNVSDNAAGDTGSLEQWCLLPTFLPDIMSTPGMITATQSPDTITTQNITIDNGGAGLLEWQIYESLVTILNQVQEGFVTAQQIVRQAKLIPTSAGEEVSDVEIIQTVNPIPPARNTIPSGGGLPLNTLYDNGPMVNRPGAGAGGADVSELQNLSLGMSTIGYAHQEISNSRVADDFTITDPGGWVIESFTFFAYQTFSPITSTITSVNYRIWDGPPDEMGSTILYGDDMTNQLVDTNWTGIYRTNESAGLMSIDRPIMANNANAGFYLPAGTYWVDWQSGGSLASGPWVPPITISDVITTGNGRQMLNGGVWGPALDGGTTAQQGMPFHVVGYAVEDIPWASASIVDGSTVPGDSTDVVITFDSTGLALNTTYQGNLHVVNNDINNPIITIPVALQVIEYKLFLPFLIAQ